MDSAVITALENFGLGGVIILAVILGYLVPKPAVSDLRKQNKDLKAENKELRQALDLERQRSDTAVQAGQVTNQLIGALANLAAERRGKALPQPMQLTGEDPGL